jgi:hypothetical protein
MAVYMFFSHISPLPWCAGRRDTEWIRTCKEEQMEADPASTPGLKRSLSVWAAAGRAVPLTFLIAAVGVLLVAAREGIAAPGTEDSAAAGRHRLTPARDEAL